MSDLILGPYPDILHFALSMAGFSIPSQGVTVSGGVDTWGDRLEITGPPVLAPGEMDGGYYSTCSVVTFTAFCNMASLAVLFYVLKTVVTFIIVLGSEEDPDLLVLFDDVTLPADKVDCFGPDPRDRTTTREKQCQTHHGAVKNGKLSWLLNFNLLRMIKISLNDFCDGALTEKPQCSKNNVTQNTQEALRWFRQAKLDLEAAFNDFDAPVPAYDWVCQKCQQATEKAVKAVLYAKGLTRNNTHDLAEMARSITNDKVLQDLVHSVQNTVGFLSFMRYPDKHPYPKVPRDVFDEKRGTDALVTSHKLFTYIEEHHGMCVTRNGLPIRNNALDASTQT